MPHATVTKDGRLLIAQVAGTTALAGLLFGFGTAVISGVAQPLAAHFALDPLELGAAVSAALWGTLVGAMTAGAPGDRYGVRRVLEVQLIVVALFFPETRGVSLEDMHRRLETV